MWLPVYGWVAVLVRFTPTARWLPWRVTGLRRMSRPRWDAAEKPDRYKKHRRSKKTNDDNALDFERTPK